MTEPRKLLPLVTRQEAAEAARWMQTSDYRARVEQLRKRANAGEAMTVEGIARDLKIPLGYVVAMVAEHSTQRSENEVLQ